MATSALPLAGLRVLELGSGMALAYCGKMFADFGAEVWKAEAPGGDPLRRVAPLAGSEGAVFAWANTNKRGVTASAERVAALLPGCDLLLDGRSPAERAAQPLGLDQPGLVSMAVSAFGESGPYRDFRFTDATLRGLASVFHCTGPEAGPPALHGGDAGEIVGAIAAFIGAAAGLLGRGKGGRRLECSLLEANLAVAEYHIAQAALTPGKVKRHGVNRHFPTSPQGVFPCAEGWLGVTIVTPAQWRGFCDMVGLPALGADPDLVVGPNRMARAEELEAQFVPRLLTRSAQSWFEEALQRRLPFVVVPDMAGLLATPVHRARGAFGTVEIGKARFEGPALPQYLTRTPPLRQGRAPLAGEHNTLPLPATRAGTGQAATGLPLEGLTVLDLSMGWAGPICTRMLGDLGARILKVEACAYPDWWRGVDPRPTFFAEKQYETNTRFNALNRNKQGITLDLTRPEGVALLKRLVRLSDAVVENYAAEVLPKLGLDYPVLQAERPDLVMVSMAAFGSSGAWKDARAYGSTLEHASGLPSVSGQADWPPMTNHLAYGDPVGGHNAAAALLVALLHRQATGEGQHIDLSQVECMFPLVAPFIVAQSVAGAPGGRLGNRHPTMVPHGIFPSGATDSWVVVAVEDDAAWGRLCALMGRADLAGLALPARRAREAELEALLGAWTRARSDDAAMLALQAAGVAAGVCRHPELLQADVQLRQRQAFLPCHRAFVGDHVQLASAFRPEGAAPLPVRAPAPTLGEHNATVLGELLGLEPAELARLAAEGIIGTEAVPVGQRKSRASAG